MSASQQHVVPLPGYVVWGATLPMGMFRSAVVAVPTDPFLQVPPYLPSQQPLHGRCCQWYGDVPKLMLQQHQESYALPHKPGPLQSPGSRMSPDAPTFIPAAQQAEQVVVTSGETLLPQSSATPLSAAIADPPSSKEMRMESVPPSAITSTSSVASSVSIHEKEMQASLDSSSEFASADVHPEQEAKTEMQASLDSSSEVASADAHREQEVEQLRSELEDAHSSLSSGSEITSAAALSRHLVKKEMAKLKELKTEVVALQESQEVICAEINAEKVLAEQRAKIDLVENSLDEVCRRQALMPPTAEIVRVSARPAIEECTSPAKSSWTPSLRPLNRQDQPTQSDAQEEPQKKIVSEEPQKDIESHDESGVHIAEAEDWAGNAQDDESTVRSPDAEADVVAAYRGQFSLDGSDERFHLDDDCIVIDPEFADPPEVVAEEAPEDTIVEEPLAEPAPPLPAPMTCSSSAPKEKPRPVERSTKSFDLHKPNIELVLGCWYDSQGSTYEVRFDRDSSSSCSVKTTRPGGAVRQTHGLIQVSHKPRHLGSIIWGHSYVLGTPLESADELRWRSATGRKQKEFAWTRWKDDEADSFSEDDSDQGHAVEANGQKGRSRGKFTGRVWRAVESKKPEAADSRCPHDGADVKPAKTPQDVAASACRRVQARSGVWRVIRK